MASGFKKATRRAVKIKIGMQGPSGSGKTLGALVLGTALAAHAGGRLAVIDTENGSASLYADRFDFDVLELAPPYETAAYVDAMVQAYEAGYKALIVDNISHQWMGAGGILARKEAVDKRGGNSWTNWQPFTAEHERFKAKLLALPMHAIYTMRSKQDYVVEENARGKSVPKKVGMAALQREGMEYEFSIMFELQMDHLAAVSKDRTSLFDGKLTDLTDMDTARRLISWMDGASDAEVAAVADAQEAAQHAAEDAAAAAAAGDHGNGSGAGSRNTATGASGNSRRTAGAQTSTDNAAAAEPAHPDPVRAEDRPFPRTKKFPELEGQLLGQIESARLVEARRFADGRSQPLVDAIDEVLANRAAAADEAESEEKAVEVASDAAREAADSAEDQQAAARAEAVGAMVDPQGAASAPATVPATDDFTF